MNNHLRVDRTRTGPNGAVRQILTLIRELMVIYNARVEQLKQEGMIRRVEDIRSEWEQDDHFDDLRRIYVEVLDELGLPWPPLIRDFMDD